MNALHPLSWFHDYRCVFISDAHLGTRGYHSDFLADLLSRIRCQHLFLVGDIIDGWSLHWSRCWDDIHDEVFISPDTMTRCSAHGRVTSVVCGIPLVLLPLARQQAFIEAIFSIAPSRGFLHFSCCVTSPLPARRHGLTAKREAWTPLHLPPVSLWRYAPTLAGSR